ncbi:hypothetical protein QNI19_14500 [Cytophagaceae bacterium DM2B3-1]|uniref:Uncharacterized protein n=1 Tax=Xanthocytophaga flava TaxID=3048013 RepID=A0ABT7CKU0_9BACT|nr:hypothetical protein [Xanthocytophaga flavus]MDJ1494151.1 hypothetical protein [Xanthocytophaga flavus]
MPLDKPGLKAAILQIAQDFNDNDSIDGETAAEQFAEKLSTAIDVFVKTGTVNTTGTASAQTGTIS